MIDQDKFQKDIADQIVVILSDQENCIKLKELAENIRDFAKDINSPYYENYTNIDNTVDIICRLHILHGFTFLQAALEIRSLIRGN